MTTVIKADHLKKVYKLYDKPTDRIKEALKLTTKVLHKDHYALNDINLEVHKGENIGIIGVNGAGKSTLLKVITGLITPTEGSISVTGRIAALIELGAGFNPEYTGRENVYFNGTIMGYTKEEMDAKVEDIINFADIGDFINQPVKTYSSGMFARLAFAVAINVNPDILIVDEALSVGDAFFQKKCYAAIKELMKEKTVLVVSHDLNAISKLCDRSILMTKGQIIYDGETANTIMEYYKLIQGAKVKNSVGTDDVHTIHELKVNDGLLDVSTDMIPIDKGSLSGALDVEMTRYKYYVNEKANIEGITSGDRLNILVELQVKRKFEDIIIGYMVEDKYGNVIFGENSITSKITDFKFSGEVCYLNLEVIWPEIKEDDYFITVGIGEGEEVMIQVEQCWAHNMIHLKNNEKGKLLYGLFNQPIEKINIY